ncbi:hypothetical protein D0B54_00050 [Solimonas sp. K1W22B-7]|uniref:hypothetical protein n=1 Tax=Solimonas sp. K1W22B-7 TaxID=2303331 RepID=UPI000E32E286|nr:hypothetical protein [Solimonas sp. K1W22B-7]AXQ27177.1 hypothetical protein D0B54_00050 [Solimonas sp. K1W22B-7]
MRRRLALGLLAALALAGCDDDKGPADNGPKVELPAMSPGAHALRLTGDAAGVSGWGFMADDGRGFVQLAPQSDAPSTVVFTRAGRGKAWRRVPAATAPQTLAAALDEPQAAAAAPVLAGSYDALLGGAPARFTVAADGALSAASGECTLSGRLDPGKAYAGAFPVQASVAGCAALAGSYRGLAFADPDAKNARFRVVLHDAGKIIDFYAFAR